MAGDAFYQISEETNIKDKWFDLIIRNASIHTMDQDQRVLNRGSIAVKGDRIALIGQEDLSETHQAGQVIDADGMILFPGFIDRMATCGGAKATVVYASSEENIDTTIVNGKIVYHKGTFAGGLSETELIREIDAEMVKGL